MSVTVKICPHNGSPKKLIKVSSLLEVIEKGTAKLNLPAKLYKIVLEEDGVILDVEDDDEIFLEMATKTVLTLKLVPEDMSDSIGTQEESVEPSQLAIPSSSTSTDIRGLVDFRSELWNKFPNGVLKTCLEKKPVSRAQRRKVVADMSDYIVDELKDKRRKTSFRVAEEIYKKYPQSFEDSIEGHVLGTGWDSLGLAIYNAVNYRADDKQKAKRTRIEMTDSDDESKVPSDTRKSRKEDEYGCVAYDPNINEEELTAQEEKRTKLLKDNENLVAPTPEIMKLMKETYPLQRKHILAHSDVEIVFSKWPYLKNSSAIIQHMEILVGIENIQEQWRTALQKYAKPIRKFLKIEETLKEHKKKNDPSVAGRLIRTMITEAKNAAQNVTKNEIPLKSVIFPLIILNFQENENELFRLEEENLTDEQLLQKMPNLTPVLIIKGRSLYDETATHTVALDKKILIPVSGVLDGILLLFSLYYVFRVLYPEKLSRTLEFIQRCLLKINPKNGHKRASKKQKATPFDLKVKKFIDGLQPYVERP